MLWISEMDCVDFFFFLILGVVGVLCYVLE